MASTSITLQEDEIQRLREHLERLSQMPPEVTTIHVKLSDGGNTIAQFTRWDKNSWSTTLVHHDINPFD